MDKYNSKIAWFIGRCKGAGPTDGSAITISSKTTWYSLSQDEVNARPRWRKHENCHKSQYARYSNRVAFWCAYVWESVKKLSYTNNRFEVEARAAAAQ